MNDKDLEYVLDGDAVLTHRRVDEYRRLLTECVIANQRKHERLAELERRVMRSQH